MHKHSVGHHTYIRHKYTQPTYFCFSVYITCFKNAQVTHRILNGRMNTNYELEECGRKLVWPIYRTPLECLPKLKMETARFSETLASTNQFTRRFGPSRRRRNCSNLVCCTSISRHKPILV